MEKFTYTGPKTREISFPLGGIGSGSIGLAGNGQLIDWEIFNRPSKGSLNGYSHLAVKAEADGRPVDARVLQGDYTKSYMGQYAQSQFRGYGYGPFTQSLAGLPHFRDTAFTGRFPLAEMTFADPHFPGRVRLHAFNPFIPLNDRDSSIPAAFFAVELTNDTEQPLTYTAALSVQNPFSQGSWNRACRDGEQTHIHLGQETKPADDPGYGDMTLATDAGEAQAMAYWYRGGWQDCLETFWRQFAERSVLPERVYDTPGTGDMATLSARVAAAPGETSTVRFVLTWNFPNAYNYWRPWQKDGKDVTWKNYYAVLFPDSRASARYSLENWDRLYRETAAFTDALFSSTLPDEVLEAVSANLSTLKSPTVLRLEDGSFYGWEGVHETSGSCEGTCTHVWNYAYALPFLFPKLERSIRELDYRYNQYPNGGMQFRLGLPLGRDLWEPRACVDGQMGGVIKSYREWKISGDDAWLRRYWPAIQKSLEYAWHPGNPDRWDANRDGVLEGRQHHTLDMELFGPSSWLEGFYLAALKAGAEMAEHLREAEKAALYRELFAAGKAWTDKNLFNGRYYEQQINLSDRSILASFTDDDTQGTYWNAEAGEIKYQIGEGCEVDQVCAQWHANLCGLGEIFDPAQLHTALRSLYRYNFKRSMREVPNPWRLYSLDDEAGVIICDYPEGARKPAIPVPYCQETMYGFGYQLAALLISEGMVDEGLDIVRAIRGHFDGEKRNPWNEFECGSNYARSMASYSLLLVLSGFSFDMTRGHIGFRPRLEARPFRVFWSLDAAWGTMTIGEDGFSLRILGGALPLRSLEVAGLARQAGRLALRLDGKPLTGWELAGDTLRFADGCTIAKELAGRCEG